jgi:hypothetical protein
LFGNIQSGDTPALFHFEDLNVAYRGIRTIYQNLKSYTPPTARFISYVLGSGLWEVERNTYIWNAGGGYWNPPTTAYVATTVIQGKHSVNSTTQITEDATMRVGSNQPFVNTSQTWELYILDDGSKLLNCSGGLSKTFSYNTAGLTATSDEFLRRIASGSLGSNVTVSTQGSLDYTAFNTPTFNNYLTGDPVGILTYPISELEQVL